VNPVGVVAALRSEIAPAVKALSLRRSGIHYDSGPLRLMAGGVGRFRAEAAARHLASIGPLSGLVSIGLCGALVDGLEPGTIVIDGAPELRARISGVAAVEGACACVDRVLNDPAGKARLASESGAKVVDMESAGVAQAAQDLGLPFLTVKAVLDTPAAPLAGTYSGIPGILGLLLLRPRAVARDARRASAASARLAEVLAAFARP
jgi:nucleoside phosphorylase